MRRDLAPSSGRHEQHPGPLMCLPETVQHGRVRPRAPQLIRVWKVVPATPPRRREDGSSRQMHQRRMLHHQTLDDIRALDTDFRREPCDQDRDLQKLKEKALPLRKRLPVCAGSYELKDGEAEQVQNQTLPKSTDRRVIASAPAATSSLRRTKAAQATKWGVWSGAHPRPPRSKPSVCHAQAIVVV